MAGTHLRGALEHAREELAQLQARLTATLAQAGHHAPPFSIGELTWARGMMLNRRFEDTEGTGGAGRRRGGGGRGAG